jgi:outer membrane murein-binding lipoprotein Lpp
MDTDIVTKDYADLESIKTQIYDIRGEEYDSLRCQIGTLKSGRGQHIIMRAFVLIRQTVAAWQSTNLKVEQLSHKVDQLNAYIEEILHDQNDVNEQQEVTNNEIAIQIEMINDALDQLRFYHQQPRPRIGYKK